jgi:NADH:ubiquinone reductase (H+-translocating)
MNQQKKHILIGGFGGLYAALELEKQLARRADVEVTLVNRENFFLFTPMLHEVAASDLDVTHIVNPIRKLLRRVVFWAGEVQAIDLETRRVSVRHGYDSHSHDLQYDHLILALGSVTHFFGMQGLQEHALTMKSLGDAIHLRNQVIAHLEEADTDCASGTRDALLTFVVAGGGFAGVETIASVNDFAREAVRFYPHLDESRLRFVLVHPGPHILPELGEKLGKYAERKLAERGVEIRTGIRVTGADSHTVSLSDGTEIPTSTLVWTAGTSPHPLVQSLPCRKLGGRLEVDAFLRVTEWPGVWALGDCAAIPDATTGKTCPPTAQHALREGRVAAENILAELQGAPLRPFRYRAIGLMASIGRRCGVASVMGLQFSGFAAWWLWRTVYLAKLPRLEKKLRVALDWTLDLLFSKDLVQFETLRAPALSAPPLLSEGDHR